MRSHLTAGILVRVAISCLLAVGIITPRARVYQPADIKKASRFRQQLALLSRVSTGGQLGQNRAHEINQPLAAMRANAEAARQLLEGEQPDLKEAREALDDILVDNKRAQEVIQGIRNLVQNKPPVRIRVDLNRVATEAVHVSQADAG